jgi:predicted metal-dependent peptidase
MGESKDNALTNALQWLCSPRGGNNFYGRILNGCRRVSTPGKGTACVSVNLSTGRYSFEYDLEWFEKLNVKEQLFVVMHEACHIVLQHIPRALWMYNNLPSGSDLKLNHKLSNCAMDFAVNSNFLRKELDEFGDKCPFLNPAMFELPHKLMFEEYLDLLIQRSEKTPMFVMSLGGSGSQQSDQANDENDDEENNDSPGDEKNEDQDDSESDDSESDEGDSGTSEDSDDTEDDSENENGGGGGAGDPGEEEETNGSSQGDGLGDLHPEFPRHTFDPSETSLTRTDAEMERLISELTKETKEMVRHAYEQTIRRRGTIPNEIRSEVEALLKEPEVPWDQILRNMMRSSIIAKMYESAVIPNYSLLPVMGMGIIPYPGLQCDTAINVSVLIDTSGSISDNDFIKFVTELNGVLQCTHGVNMHVVMFDAYIQYEHYLSELEADELRTEMKAGKASYDRHGRGGTDFNPPFQCVSGVDRDTIPRISNCAGNWAEHRFKKPDLVVFLTDGCAPVDEESGGPIPVYQPDCPVIWVICGGSHAQVHPAMGQRVVVLSE